MMARLMPLTAPGYIALVVACACASVAGASPARGAGAALPIAKLTVEATSGGEPTDLDLGADGAVTLRVAPARDGKRVARIVGSTVVAVDGRVLASVGPRGRLTVLGLEKPMRLRGCSLSEGDEGMLTLGPGGDFQRKPPGRKRFGLPAGVRGDVRRACPTALLLYRVLPLLLDPHGG
jgi:hypothetical protein